jgi:tripartite-type tricarboxylate transporter receptor subunit TctC
VTKFVLTMSLAILLLVVCTTADAAFPEKNITILNSSTAGSPTDLLARQVAHYTEPHLKQPLIVLNKPGGGGGVMFAALLAAPTDGYTIGSVTAAQMAALQAQLKNDFSFDSFDFLCNVQLEPYAIAVLTDSPWQSIGDVVEAAKSGKNILFGGQGTGSSMHLMALQLSKLADVKFTWLPYQGGAESVTNLLGGHAEIIATAPATVMQYVEAGQVKVLAISGESRLSYLPDAPTLKELGYDIVLTQYRGFIAKKGIPEEIKAQLVDAISKGIREPGFKEFMAQSKQEDGYMDPAAFYEYAKKDFDKIGELMQLMQ